MESNKLIAEFMGAELKAHPFDGKMCHYFKNTPTPHSAYYWTVEAMEYHLRWDWLMPVVEKIDALSDFTLVKIERNTCQIMHAKAPYIYIAAENKITATYDAVIQFIEWYNQQPNH